MTKKGNKVKLLNLIGVDFQYPYMIGQIGEVLGTIESTKIYKVQFISPHTGSRLNFFLTEQNFEKI